MILKSLQSSIGKKYVMAVTGCILFAFVIGHMIGNLQIFLGAEKINNYAAFLRSQPGLLWTARIGLLISVILHIVSAVQISRQNKAARPVPYASYQPVGSSYASRTMLMSGLIIFTFVIYHLLHFTWAIPQVNLLEASPSFPNADFHELRDAKGRHDVYQMMLLGYSNLWVSGFYILGMALLCLHLSHGVSSMFQSLGWKNQCYGKYLDCFARTSALVIFIGNSSIPLAVLMDRKFHLIQLFS